MPLKEAWRRKCKAVIDTILAELQLGYDQLNRADFIDLLLQEGEKSEIGDLDLSCVDCLH